MVRCDLKVENCPFLYPLTLEGCRWLQPQETKVERDGSLCCTCPHIIGLDINFKSVVYIRGTGAGYGGGGGGRTGFFGSVSIRQYGKGHDK